MKRFLFLLIFCVDIELIIFYLNFNVIFHFIIGITYVTEVGVKSKYLCIRNEVRTTIIVCN